MEKNRYENFYPQSISPKRCGDSDEDAVSIPRGFTGKTKSPARKRAEITSSELRRKENVSNSFIRVSDELYGDGR